MKETYQTKDNPINGNCLAACLASIFEDDIDSYPELPNDHTWAKIMNEYLIKTHGVYMFPTTTDKPSDFIVGFHLIVGDNEISGCTHCVVGLNGQVFFNPSKSGNPITNLRYLLLVKHII